MRQSLTQEKLQCFIGGQVRVVNVHGASSGPLIVGQGEIEGIELDRDTLSFRLRWWGEKAFEARTPFVRKGDRLLATGFLSNCQLHLAKDDGTLMIIDGGRTFLLHPPGAKGVISFESLA